MYDFEQNPLTTKGVELGRELFYSTLLSRDSSISCSSCHLSYTDFTHIDHNLSHGIEDRIGTRNTLSIMNPAWKATFRWDGGIENLDLQPLAPLTSHEEMDMDTTELLVRIKSSDSFVLLFKEVFGEQTEISNDKLLQALSQFMLTFNTYNSKYDKVMSNEKGAEFTEREEKGLAVFRVNCSSCHQEPLFSNNTFQNNGLPVDLSLNDRGRMAITGKQNDSLKFRVPSLRNIEVSYPYMHDGRLRNIQSALFHYTNGIVDSETLAPQLKGGLQLSEDEKRNLVIFLRTLTDVSFLRNKTLLFL